MYQAEGDTGGVLPPYQGSGLDPQASSWGIQRLQPLRDYSMIPEAYGMTDMSRRDPLGAIRLAAARVVTLAEQGGSNPVIRAHSVDYGNVVTTRLRRVVS